MRAASRVIAAAFLLAIVAGCSLNYPQPRRFAIVYGINTYPNGNNLTYPVADATSIGAMLVANGFASADVKVATEATATKANLVADLAAFASLMGPNDLFVFYYSGHGTTLPYQGTDHDWILPTGSINASSQLIVIPKGTVGKKWRLVFELLCRHDAANSGTISQEFAVAEDS